MYSSKYNLKKNLINAYIILCNGHRHILIISCPTMRKSNDRDWVTCAATLMCASLKCRWLEWIWQRLSRSIVQWPPPKNLSSYTSWPVCYFQLQAPTFLKSHVGLMGQLPGSDYSTTATISCSRSPHRNGLPYKLVVMWLARNILAYQMQVTSLNVT